MFSDRIRKRQQLWWRNPGTSQTLIEHLQRLEMLHVHIRRDAPDSRWQRGKYWQRRLLNKLNAKEFAIRQGCGVPELYWHGYFLSESVLSSLPDRFVLKPVLGKAGHGAYAMDGSTDLLSGRVMTRKDLFREVADTRGRLSHIPLLAEEFIPGQGAAHTLPVEYKFHVFRETIGAIQVVHRLAKNAGAATSCGRHHACHYGN